ncbi:MAG TPA: response regulator, partial [Noviherbaspirillum sp.]|nr:response regulator [Noviherbaspirillum sp.]
GWGSEFVIRLPRAASEDAPPGGDDAGTQERAPASASLRLLVVDDNVDAANTLASLLRSAGHQVSIAYDAREALACAERESPHALLLDIGLPDIDGFELARRLRRLPQTAKATLVAVTGYGRNEDRARSKASGFDHHFVKPVDPRKLARLLDGVAREPGSA